MSIIFSLKGDSAFHSYLLRLTTWSSLKEQGTTVRIVSVYVLTQCCIELRFPHMLRFLL